MGVVCQPCYNEETQRDEMKEKTLKIQAGPQMNNIKFFLSTEQLTNFHCECLIIYADHCSQMTISPAITHLTNKSRRKLFQYIVLAQEHTEQKSQTHYLTPITIPNFDYKYLLFVKLRPWDGKSLEGLQRKLYALTRSYLQVFQLRKIRTFTILEPDICLGIHYSVFCQTLKKIFNEYSKNIKKVIILFNSPQSITYFTQNIKKKSTLQIDNPESNTVSNKKKTKSKKQIEKKKLLREENQIIY